MKNQIKYRFQKLLLSAAILAISLFFLTGCIPNGYTRAEKNAFLREAEEIALDYLKSVYDGAKVKEIQPEITVEDMEYVLTEFARGQFRWQGQLYFFTVNTETGEVYTSVRLDEIKRGLEETLRRDLETDIREMSLENCSILYRQGGSADPYTFSGVFPEGETTEELLQGVLTDAGAYSCSMDIQYKGGDIPQEMMESDAPFPTLTDIGLYHIADEYDLYEGEYRETNLSVLSEETLHCEYKEDSAAYVKNEVMERGSLRVVYSAYERKRKQESVTERRISEKDIRLTVTEDYIALDSREEGLTLYLMTTDEKIAEEYVYAFNDMISEQRPLKGMWYPCGDAYIYSEGKNIEWPHNFSNYQQETNVLFSRENYNRH